MAEHKQALLITEMELDTAKLLSLVDAGASGDDDTRPSIVLFKRRKEAMQMNDEQRIEVAKILKDVALEKMGVADVVIALDELGLKPEQRNEVLKLMEAVAGKTEEAPAETPEAPAEKADPEGDDKPEPPAEEVEKEEDEEMEKRAKEHKAELAKRDERIQKLEDNALTVRMEKRADELAFIPGFDRDELIDLCKRADGDEKLTAALTKLAKASADSPILKAAGVVSTDDDTSAHATLEKRVTKLMDADPKLTKAKAKSIAFKNDGELFRAVKAEQN